MIIVGYPGIGKTTIAKKSKEYIDLESSNMWIPAAELWDRTRWSNWFIPYCQIAIDLSEQGYVVFVSSHDPVVDFLQQAYEDSTYVCYPSVALKDAWIEKLRERRLENPSGKNKSAFERAQKCLAADIEALKSSRLKKLEITDMSYNLEEMIKGVMTHD